MKQIYGKLTMGITILAVILAIIIYPENNSDNFVQKGSKKTHKKSLIVNGQKYDGPEKFAYYQSAIRAGQEDLNAPMKHPQYNAFSKVIELKKAKQKNAQARTSAIATFKERGPSNVPGRTRSIIIDPEDTSGETWFAANVSGGIWKTTNSGGTWVEITPDLENIAFVTLAMSASNPSIIYAGTGEGFIFGGTLILNGNGIYKSVDKGVTWSILSSTTNNNFINVSRVIVDPTNPDILVASTSGLKILGSGARPVGAIMRSTDGGVSWVKKYTATAPVQQIIAAPSDFNIQYASINGTGVVQSTDAGLTWGEKNTGLALDGRMELAVSHSDPDRVYGSAQGTLSGTSSDLYLTENGGTSWSLIDIEYENTAVNFLGGQGWYDNTIMVNPFDDHNVYFGGVGIFSATLNASSTNADLDIVADPYNDFNGSNSFGQGTTNGVHPDQHFMTSIVTNSVASEFKIVLGNDGGIYVTDAGTTPGIANGSWTWAGADYNTTQFYGADKLAGQEEYIGGTQDNGTWVSKDNEIASPTSAYGFLIGGDGFEVAAHYTNPNKYIGGSQNNGFRGFEDGVAYNATKGLSGNGPFVSRLSSAYQDPDVLFAVEALGVYKSTDFGRNWKQTSITTGWGFWSGTDVEVSKADPRIVWAGGRMDLTGNLFVSQDGGLTFEAVSIFDNIGLCTGLYSHPTDANTVFAVFSVANSPKVLKTTDLGQTWVDISGYSSESSSTGFPDVATFALQAMPYDDNVLWAGTEIGLFESLDGGATWDIVNNFPSVTIWDFKIKNGQVIIATHGRGIWSADIPELTDFVAPTVTLAPIITGIGASLEALRVDMTINLRSSYDNLEVLVNDVVTTNVAGNATAEIQDISADVTSAGTYTIQVVSYKDGISYYTEKFTVNVTNPVTPVSAYSTDFENLDAGEFTLDNWTIDTPTGFSNNLLSTTHPYPLASELLAQLNTPIIVASQNATISFQEVVQVEEGDPGTVFGDERFWDYVIVEGSIDGIIWTSLLNGYDSDANSSWDGTSTTASSALFVERSINMLDTYTAGDIVLLRFRLFSDAGAVAWGWGIDDLVIQATDEDGDGFDSGVDCDDTNANIYPGATEIPFNGIDEDCNGSDSLDGDGDGFDLADDCDDTNADIYPGADEIGNNGIDEDCNGEDLIVAGTNDPEIASKINVYPNPSSGEINIDFDNILSGQVKLQVMDSNGKILLTESIDNTNANAKSKVNLSNLTFGLYVIILSDDTNTITKRVLIY